MESVGKRKRHILIIVENGPVPFDRRVWLEAKTLKKNNYNVTVICPKGINCNNTYDYLEGVHINRYPIPQETESIKGYIKEYLLSLLWEWFLSFKIYIRKHFDVIQACNPPDTIFLIAIFFKILGVKFVFDHHDLTPEGYFAKFGKKDFIYKVLLIFEKLTFKSADISIATNKSYRDIAIKRGGMKPEKVFVVRTGPESKKFKKVPIKDSLKHGKKFLVGYVGNMGKQEGIDFLINVVKYIVREKGRKDIHFTCVGEGPSLNNLKELSANMNLNHYINFTGRIPDKELSEILSTSDVCVNPDVPNELNDKSTMVKIMEYMAFGKPIVQFDFKEGKFSAKKASLYAKKGSVNDYGDKILELINNENLRKEMGDFGFRRVRDKLDWKYSIPNLLMAYKALYMK